MRKEVMDRIRANNDLLFHMMLGLSALLAVFAVILQPGGDLLDGLWRIQTGHAGLITDPMITGGAGAALLNASLLLMLSTLIVRLQRMPFTGLSVASLFLMAGFSLLGKNLINSVPILLGGFLYSRYKAEHFSKYTYQTLFATCLSPMVSYFMLHLRPDFRLWGMALGGMLIGFVVPPISGHTVRVHQGYNLYNVGFAAGFAGLSIVSVLRGFGVEFHTVGSWSTEYSLPLTILMLCVLACLFVLGVLLGCRRWSDYRRLLRHSGRVPADFLVLEGLGATFVNMALTGAIGLGYLMLVRAPLNGPLVCCLFTIIGFSAFGKHPRNIVPVMGGAVLAAVLMKNVPLTAPGVLLATLLCTGIAPVAGQYGVLWGMAAGFLHMAVVQNTSYLYGGLNLYNNGFAAGLTCVVMIPLIEALKEGREG